MLWNLALHREVAWSAVYWQEKQVLRILETDQSIQQIHIDGHYPSLKPNKASTDQKLLKYNKDSERERLEGHRGRWKIKDIIAAVGKRVKNWMCTICQRNK